MSNKTYKGDSFRELLKQYSIDRAAVDPVYKRDLDRAMAERRKAQKAREKEQNGDNAA